MMPSGQKLVKPDWNKLAPTKAVNASAHLQYLRQQQGHHISLFIASHHSSHNAQAHVAGNLKVELTPDIEAVAVFAIAIVARQVAGFRAIADAVVVLAELAALAMTKSTASAAMMHSLEVQATTALTAALATTS